MECKKALEAAENDMDGAIDWLRKHGAAKASSKLQGRETSEGLVGLRVQPNAAAIVKVASETDFAGRSEAFSKLVTHVVNATLDIHDKNGEIEQDALMAASVDSKTVKDALDEAIVAIRENLSVPYAGRCTAPDDKGCWVGYVHGRLGSSDVVGTAAALVHVTPKAGKDLSKDELQDAGKKLAMHVVAARPTYLSPEVVPEEVLERERDILREQVRSG